MAPRFRKKRKKDRSGIHSVALRMFHIVTLNTAQQRLRERKMRYGNVNSTIPQINPSQSEKKRVEKGDGVRKKEKKVICRGLRLYLFPH